MLIPLDFAVGRPRPVGVRLALGRTAPSNEQTALHSVDGPALSWWLACGLRVAVDVLLHPCQPDNPWSARDGRGFFRSWVQIIRGPRPPSVRWPMKGEVSNTKSQKERRSSAAPQDIGKGSTKPIVRQKDMEAERGVPAQVRRGPPEVSTAVQDKVARLRAAVDAMSNDDSPEARTLREGLKKGQQEATAAPVGLRLDACARFIDRARQRLNTAEEAVRQA